MPVLPPREELRNRLDRFRELMDRQHLNGFLVTDEADVRYLSGFTGGDSVLLITSRQKLLLTDFRYVEEARLSAPGWRIVTRPSDPMEKAGLRARSLRIHRLGIAGEHLTVHQMKRLRKATHGVVIKPVLGLVGELRLCKSAWEVSQIESALRIQEDCFRQVCRKLVPGMHEYELAAELRYRMVKAGAEDQAFPVICQFGAGSSLPHGRPTDRRLRADSIILMDWGARQNGYHSDLTRSFFIGSIPKPLREIHGIVAEAQALAKACVAPGVPFAEVDEAARRFIRKSGYGKYFGHSTGHGLGLRIHEPPALSRRGKGLLKPGMVITIEPGIYLPGKGGVRIEDDVLVTEKGYRVLSRLPRGLRWNGNGD
jgi:Xaa-Pro aminopeptidase